MANENIVKFYTALTSDKALAEKLAAAEKAYADTHEMPAADADEKTQLAFRREAVKEIVLPIAAEEGFPFTIEEVEAYEREQVANLEMSDDELDQVAGGVSFHFAWGISVEICYTHGAGVAAAKETDTGTVKACCGYGAHGKTSNINDEGASGSICVGIGISLS